MQIVPRVNTPLTKAAAFLGLLRAAPTITRETAGLLLALIWLETGRGQSVYGWNVGNVAAGASWFGSAWRPTWFAEPTESSSARDRQLHADMLAGKAPSAFRSYPSAESGFDDFVRVLRTSFGAAWDAAGTGDADEFRSALASSRYAPEYSAPSVGVTLAKLRDEFASEVSVLRSAPTLPARRRLVLLVLVALYTKGLR